MKEIVLVMFGVALGLFVNIGRVESEHSRACEDRLNEYGLSATETKAQWCERTYPLWEETRDFLAH